MVTVITAYPGASPKDVAEQVTKPIEQGVANISGVKSCNPPPWKAFPS